MLLKFTENNIKESIQLPGSKSISNRLLILNEVLKLKLKFENLSTAKDTEDLVLALKQIKKGKDRTIDIGHAGTDMRFLTALLSLTDGEWTLTGSERMKQRPIAELVNALKQLGAQISYLENEGFPPLKITGTKLSGSIIEIDGSISSQFISALLLIAPILDGGLELKIKGEIVSWSYILMTLDLLSEFGIKVSTVLNTITVKPSIVIRHSSFEIESDWSSASYWYSIVALSKNAEITLLGLTKGSSQGDSVLPEIYRKLGVNSEFKNGDLLLRKSGATITNLTYDFSDCPDIAQTVAVTCLGLKINCHLTGLSTLKHKETDRLLALKNELEKFGSYVTITNDSIEIENNNLNSLNLTIETYNDHRMAMCFAPLALIYNNLNIQNPEVVQKSYPLFWEHLKLIGVF